MNAYDQRRLIFVSKKYVTPLLKGVKAKGDYKMSIKQSLQDALVKHFSGAESLSEKRLAEQVNVLEITMETVGEELETVEIENSVELRLALH